MYAGVLLVTNLVEVLLSLGCFGTYSRVVSSIATSLRVVNVSLEADLLRVSGAAPRKRIVATLAEELA